ncbi:MAG: hypothetical protein QM756_10565 [Polyangiaceae bacterium]
MHQTLPLNHPPQVTPPTRYRWGFLGGDIAAMAGWGLVSDDGRSYRVRRADGLLTHPGYDAEGLAVLACLRAALVDKAARYPSSSGS